MTAKPMAAKAPGAAPAKPAKPQGRKRAGRGTLLVIATLLAGSGIIRLGEGAGVAFANASDPAAPAEMAGEQICEPNAGALAMLDELRAREERLAAREGAIADRAQALAVADAQVSEKLAALVAAEDALAATMVQAEAASETDVAKLTAVYESMKPKLAAPVFAEMAPEFAAGFLGRMRPDAAAAIMAGLDPKAAYAISVLLAGRNANVPKN